MPFIHVILTHWRRPEADRNIRIPHGGDEPPTQVRQFTLFAGVAAFDEYTLTDMKDWPYSATYEYRRTTPCTTRDLPFNAL